MNGQLKPLGFFSRQTSSAESRYSAYDLELLAVYSTIVKFRHVLEGRRFKIYTDQKPLTVEIFEIDSHQSRKLSFTNLSECFLPKFMDNGFGESNCCPSGVPNSLVYGLQFCCPVGNRHPRLDGSEVLFTTPRKTASLKGRCFRRTVRSRHFSH